MTADKDCYEKPIQRVLIITDAWEPQVNGVVRTLQNTIRELSLMDVEVGMITPKDFRTLPCPTYPEIRLSLASRAAVEKKIVAFNPDALHIATEGPLGWAARSVSLKYGWGFTTAYHTRFPEYVHSRIRMPLSLSYSVFRRFHQPSSAVLVPTNAMITSLKKWRFKNLQHWSRGVDHDIFNFTDSKKSKVSKTPIFLYTGRLAIEKNVEEFLKLDLPGEKWAAGDGPMSESLKKKYPSVKFVGVLSQKDLAKLYNQADVFVFPSITDTFGLVMVEAMACGLPVAAYPVEGPIDVVGKSGAGVLNTNLRDACLAALEIKTECVLKRASMFTWAGATKQFYSYLKHVNVKASSP